MIYVFFSNSDHLVNIGVLQEYNIVKPKAVGLKIIILSINLLNDLMELRLPFSNFVDSFIYRGFLIKIVFHINRRPSKVLSSEF